MAKQVKLSIQRVLGAASVFRQGGSLRLVLPKKAFSLLKVPKGSEDSDVSTVIMLATDKGILLLPLEDYVKNEDINET